MIQFLTENDTLSTRISINYNMNHVSYISVEIIPVKILNPQYVVRIQWPIFERPMTSLWRHLTLFWLQLDIKMDLCFSETWCPVFVRQLSVFGIFDSDTSKITLIMGLLRTKNWNERQKILKILPRKSFRFIKNWHYGIIRFEIISIRKNISVERVPIIKTQLRQKSQDRHQYHVKSHGFHRCWCQL